MTKSISPRDSYTRALRRRRAARCGAVFVALGALAACEVLGGAAPAPEAAEPAAGPLVMTSPFGAYLAGRHAQHEKDYGAAAGFFERALAIDGNDYDLMSRTLLLDASEGRIDAAVPLAQRVTAIEPNAAIGNLVLVVDKAKSGDYAGAARYAAALPRDGIHRFATLLVNAWIKTGEGQPVSGIAALQPLGETRGFGPLKEFHAALIDDVAGLTPEAEEAYQKLQQSSTRLNWRGVEMLGAIFERTGRPEEARQLYQRFAQETQDTDFVGPALERLAKGAPPARRVADAKDGLAEAFFDLGSIMSQGETTDLGLIYARLALHLRPDFPAAQMLVADILEIYRRPEEALAINRAIDPKSAYGWSARARIASDLDQLGRTDEAVAELKAMAAERPNRASPLVQLGDLLRAKSRYPEAIQSYDEAASRLGPDEQRLWNFYYSRGVALERDGKWERSETDLKRALELQPDQPLVLNYLGYSWVDKGRNLQDGLKMIERAVQLRPNDGYIVDSLGWAHYRLGDFAKATQYLERAIELRPQDPTINDHLGDVFWQTGRFNEARAQWRRALLFGPEANEVKAIETKLDRGLAKPAAVGGPTPSGG
jgi:tetratricopeptide (TPR) repeat protein